jgi:DNA-directed RNA polymerase subunit RPC12/RpoP
MNKCLECGKEVLRLNNRRNRDNGKVICIDCKRKLREIQIKNLKNVG